MRPGFSQCTKSSQNLSHEILHEQTVFLQLPAQRTGKTRVKVFQGEFSPFLSHCFVQDAQVPAYGHWPPYSLPQLLIADVSPKNVRAGKVWGGLSLRYPTVSEKQQFRNILDCRLHQDTLFLPLNCTLSRNCSQPHTYKTSCVCVYTYL